MQGDERLILWPEETAKLTSIGFERRNVSIHSSDEELAKLRNWHIEKLLKLKEAILPVVAEVAEQYQADSHNPDN